MKERPILFSAPMVRAILDGSKTQTRRLVRPQPLWIYADTVPVKTTDADPAGAIKCPYGQPGDLLYVRETFALESSVEDNKPPFSDGRPVFRPAPTDEMSPAWLQPHYKATDPTPDLCCERTNCRDCADQGYGPHWRPSIHMPRWASRITLEVVSVRVERLQDISEQDAIAEGIEHVGGPTSCSPWKDYSSDQRYQFFSAPSASFRSLWESINGPGSWDASPFVWVVEFRRVDAA